MSTEKTSRQTRILAELDHTPSLRVAELAQKLAVSTETIRRDLDALTGQGLLNRTYGGAIRPAGAEPPVQERYRQFTAERARIAAAVLPLIRAARVLIIGSGSTTVHVAQQIAAQMQDVIVIAHSYGVAQALSVNPGIKILMLPGNFNADEGTMLGAHSVAFLNNVSADAAILGASGLAGDGPSDALLETGAVYSAMMARAARTILVADHSKFSTAYPARYAAWRQVSDLVTDRAPDAALRAALDENGVTVHHGDND
jgi:DeoR/GlpR family transcriptional regulator of sugar metabolism